MRHVPLHLSAPRPLARSPQAFRGRLPLHRLPGLHRDLSHRCHHRGSTVTSSVHPIESDSYRILADRIDLSHWPPTPRAVVERVIHASADPEYASTMSVPLAAVYAGVAAIRDGAPVITDVEMTRAGITGVPADCLLGEAVAADGLTRSAAAMRLAAMRHPEGSVVVIGCAPTALQEVVTLAGAGAFSPAL